MSLYDGFLLVGALALGVRGWMRGFVREVVDVVVLIIGLALVFRVSGTVGVILASMANVPYEAGRIAAGVLLFVGLVVAGAVVGRLITSGLHILPGGSILNRLGGAAVGVVYGAVLAVFVTTLLGVVPLPSSQRSTVDNVLGDSAVADVVNDPDGTVQQFVGSVSGDSVVQSVLVVRDAVGDRIVAGTIPVPLPSVAPSDLSVDPLAASLVATRLDGARLGAGENPLAISEPLSRVAVTRARRAYLSGVLSLDGNLSADLAAEGVPGSFHTDAIVLGATPDGVAEALLATSTYRSAIEGGEYNKVGIAVIDGPVGMVGVIVLTP